MRSFYGGKVEGRIVLTKLPHDGPVVHATVDGCSVDPKKYGYESAWDMTCDHDPAHLWLSLHLGLISSPTLENKAGGVPVSHDLVAYEEAAVLAVQAFRNAAQKEGWVRDIYSH